MRAKFQAFARMALRFGVAIETLNSLSALLDPSLVEMVLEAYWEQDGAEPRIYTISLAHDLLAVARATSSVDSIALEKLAGFARRLSRLLKKSVRLCDKGGRRDFLRVDAAHF